MRRRSLRLTAIGLAVACLAGVVFVQLVGASVSTFTFHVNGAVLKGGQKYIVEKAAKSVTPYKFEAASGILREECEDANISKASQIQGGVPGFLYTIMDFTNCKASYTGKTCIGATAKSELLEAEQAEIILPEKEKGGIAAWIRSAEPNEVLFNLNATCEGKATKYALSGSIGARYSTEYTEAKIHGLAFPNTQVQVVEDFEGVPNEVGLTAGEEGFWLTGEAFLSLEKTPMWSVW
jgi:hypothetical protein